MTGEWIKFGICAVLLAAAMIAFTAAVIGVYRFGYVLNRMHAGAIGDTLGFVCVILTCMICAFSVFDALKLVVLVLFLWFTTPVDRKSTRLNSSH